MTPEDPAPPPRRLRPIPWWFAVGGLVAIGLSIWGVYGWLSAAASGADSAKDAQVQVEIIRSALTVGAGLGGVAALLLAFRRQQFAERQHLFNERQQAHHERVTEQDYRQRERDAIHRRITEMRIQAVEQLGSEKAPVRIGGLHNLERLGEEHPELRRLVLSEICAYLRLPYEPAEVVGEDAEKRAYARVEREVRQTAQRVLKRHLSGGAADEYYWEHEALDLSGAVLEDFDLRRCHLHGANFFRAEFHGIARFSGTEFFRGPVFTGAAFHDSSSFRKAVIHGCARFNGTKFRGTVSFEATEFDEEPDFFATSAPMEHVHDWPSGWELTPSPQGDGMGRLNRTDR